MAKKFNKAEAKANREEKVEAIMAQLETGIDNLFSSDKYKAYLTTLSKFHTYSFGNCLLIAMQSEGKATRVAGYKAWQDKFNRHVKANEKALRILAPIVHKYTKRIEKEDGSIEEAEGRYITYRAVSVFDVSQTEGEALPTIYTVRELPETEREDHCKRLFKRIAKLSSVPVTTEKIESGANGFFSPVENRIVVKEGLTSTHSVKTLIHELAHSKMHGKGCQWEEADRGTKEMQAESVAYTVCSHLGIDTSEYSFSYIVGWSKGKDHKQLKDNLEAIKKIASEIIDGIESDEAK